MEQSKLILEVQSRPCLWNPNVDSYYDCFERRRAWEEVAAILCRGFRNFSDDEKREAVQELQRNWKSLKDYHNRRNPSDDIDESIKRQKLNVELLQFSDKVTKYEVEAKQQMPQSVKQRGKNKKKDLLSYPEEEDLSFRTEAQSLDPNQMKHDANINFLQSILPEMQSLNDLQKFEFKWGVMRLVNKIKYNEEEDGTSAPMNKNHDNCELIKSRLLLPVNRCNRQTSPNINNAEMDVSSPKTLDVKSQNISKD